MTENEKARELIATSETTVKVDPQNGWYLKRFAALQFGAPWTISAQICRFMSLNSNFRKRIP